MHTYKFKTNINCGNCVKNVSSVLNADPKIKTWNVDTAAPSKELTIEVDEDIMPEYVSKLIKLRGFSAEPI